MTKIAVIKGNIAKQAVDAIVNAANKTLLGGGGVDGAIHAAAGPQLLQECRTLHGCETGEAKITKGYNLPAAFVIHTVGPVYGSENGREAALLERCYRSSITLADQYGLKSIAFPSISTGAYGYPIDKASRIALRTVKDLSENGSTRLHDILFVTFSDSDLRVYLDAYREFFGMLEEGSPASALSVNASKEVLISYSSKDQQAALQICKLLEQKGIACWIAPRDIPPGKHYAEEIVNAIDSAAAIVLLVSENANESIHVRNEIAYGVSRGKTVFPVRIRNVEPAKALRLYIATSQWIDMGPPFTEQRVAGLAAAIRGVQNTEPAALPRIPQRKDPDRGSSISKRTGITFDEWLVLNEVRGKPDVRWTSDLITQSIWRNRRQLAEKAESIEDAIRLLVTQGYFTQTGDELKVTGKAVDFYRNPQDLDPSVRSVLSAIAQAGDYAWLGSPPRPERGPGPLLFTLKGHSERVTAVAVTMDGRRGLSASANGTLRLWDLEKGAEIHALYGHLSEVRALTLTTDGKRAISVAADHTLKVWDLEIWYELRALHNSTHPTTCIAVATNGKRVVSGSSDGKVRVWDFDDESNFFTFSGHTSSVKAVALTPDGRRALSASQNGAIRVWDIEHKTELQPLVGHAKAVHAVAVTSDGTVALSGSVDGSLKVWDVANGLQRHHLAGHTDFVQALAMTPDGKLAVSGSADGTMKVWNLEQGIEVRTLAGHREAVSALTMTPDGTRAISGSSDHTVKVWDLSNIP